MHLRPLCGLGVLRNESLGRCRSKHKAAFERLVNHVEWKLIEMPLPRVQIVSDREDRFIYEISWTRDWLLANQKAFHKEVSANQRGERSDFDKRGSLGNPLWPGGSWGAQRASPQDPPPPCVNPDMTEDLHPRKVLPMSPV